MIKRTLAICVLSAVWGIVIFPAFFTGCATTVSFQVQRPPTLNTLGIQRLAVMPFTTSDNSSLQRQAAVWLTNESLSRINAANHFTLINSSEIQRVQSARGNIENLADALFSGQVVSLVVQNSSSPQTRKDKDGNDVSYPVYQREVQMSFNYGLTLTRGGEMIGPINKTNLRISDSNENRNDLKTAEVLIQRLIQSNLTNLARDVAPYTAIERRSLHKETSNDRAVKQRAKNAEALVKAGSFRSAQDAFMGIYRDTGSLAAGLNAGILIEAQGDIGGASAFMQRVYGETGSPKAADEIARLRKAAETMSQYEAYVENQSRRDRVIALMIDTLPSRMPAGAKVAFINNSQNEKDITEAVINGIMEGFLSKNITVIDRNSRALVEMEKNYHLSGFVSDDDIVSIGHEAGVNTFILAAVTGSGGSRRLSVRMLDVERNIVLYQSPQTDEMNL